MFDQILDLISQPPGSLVYHFIVLFAVEATLAIGFGQWMRDRDKSTARLTISAVTIFAARALLLVAALLVWRGYLPGNVLIPPIERAVDTVTIVALAWVFITMDDPAILGRNFAADVSAAVLVGMMIAGFVGTYYYWFFAASRGELFNGLWLDIAWSVAQVVIALVGLVWMLTRIRYVYDAVLKGLMLVILGGASALHLVRPSLGDVASAVHLGQLIAMPMLAAVAYRHVIEKLLHWDEFEPSREMPAVVMESPAPIPVSVPSPPQVPTPQGIYDETVQRPKVAGTASLLDVVEALGGLMGTLDQHEIVMASTKAVATALRADMAALAVVDEDTQEAGLLGGYDNIAQSYLPQAVLDLAQHPAIVNTLGRLKQMRLTTQRNLKELKDFYRKLGITNQGPAYMQPLIEDDDRIGVLVVGSPYSERQLSVEERNLLDRLGPLVARALINAERYQKARQESDEVTVEEGARLASLLDELTATTAELNDARRQTDEMKAYIRDMHRQLEAAQAQEEANRIQKEALQAEADRLRQGSGAEENPAVRQAQAEIERLREDNEQLLQRVLQQKHETDQLRQKNESRESSPPPPVMGEALNIQRELEETRIALQTELASMRARMTQASIGQQEVAFLQEQLAAKAREAIGLQSRLVEAQAVIEALREQVGSSARAGEGLETLQSRVAAQANEIAELKARLEAATLSLQTEALRAGAHVEQMDREATGEFQAALSERATLIESLQAQLAEKSRAISELGSHMSDIERSLHNLERQLSHKTDEVASLQASLSEARMQAQAALQVQAESDVEGSEVARAQVAALEAQLAEKGTSIEVLEAQLQSASQSIAEMEQRLSETHEAVDAAISGAQQGDSHDEVIASIAQELRTPMSSIMGYTELLLRESVGILGSLQRKFLQRVKANTERMGVLLEDLIRITALDTGRMQLEPQRVDVIYAVEETVMNVASQFREKGLTLWLTLAEGMPPITADRDALLQIFGHLLSNAALASPVEGAIELMVTARKDTLAPQSSDALQVNCLYISVEDSGEGVSEEDYERVFMRKYRADNPLIEGLGDTGVSLSLAKALIDAHSGRIWLDSEKGKGTRFHVLLPLSPLTTEAGA